MYEFTATDLNYNQHGQLSPTQRQWLSASAGYHRRYSWRTAIAMTIFTFVGLCIILMVFLFNEGPRKALLSDPMNLVVLMAVVPAVIVILGLAIFFNYRTANKLDNAVLSSVSGAVRFDEDSSGESGITTYYVIVDKKKFKFADDMSSIFQEGGKYKFYYCSAGAYELVMSYEKITR